MMLSCLLLSITVLPFISYSPLLPSTFQEKMALSWVEQDHAITVYVHFNEKHQINNLKMKETIAGYMDILLISQGGKRAILPEVIC